MLDAVPCSTVSPWVVAFNATLNVVQAVLLALVAQRSVRKNREERQAEEERRE